MSGEYIGIGSDIDKNLNTFYFIKIGTSKDSGITRCDRQRLKFVGSVTVKPTDGSSYYYIFEKEFLDYASNFLDRTTFDYSAGGHTESFGKFFTAKDALVYAVKIFSGFNPKINYDQKVIKYLHPMAEKLAAY